MAMSPLPKEKQIIKYGPNTTAIQKATPASPTKSTTTPIFTPFPPSSGGSGVKIGAGVDFDGGTGVFFEQLWCQDRMAHHSKHNICQIQYRQWQCLL